MNPSLCQRRHSAHEDSLEDAVALAAKAETVHRQDDSWPHGLSDDLEEILDRTVVHQQREQAVVFPMLTAGVRALPAQTVDDMMSAHEDLLQRWRQLGLRTGGFEAPDHACATWRRLYLLCRVLEQDCRVQVDLENRMLAADLRNDTEPDFVPAQRL